MTRRELKELSKSQLKGNWKIPVLIMLAYTVLAMAVSFISNFSAMASVFWVTLIFSLGLEIWFYVGFSKFFLKFSDSPQSASFDDILVSKKAVFKSTGLFGLMWILGTLVGLIVGIGLSSMIVYSILSESISTSMIIGSIIIGLVIAIPITIIELALSMSSYIFVDKEDLGFFESMSLSIKMMKGNKWKLFVINLSFIGWAILCLITFGIGFLWLVPYIHLTITNFYKDLDRSFTKYLN